jgi:hypothetical protein
MALRYRSAQQKSRRLNETAAVHAQKQSTFDHGVTFKLVERRDEGVV